MPESSASGQQAGPPVSPAADGSAGDFPPREIGTFLRFCAGEWMGLRSHFALEAPLEGGDGDEWHSSARGELVVAYLEPSSADSPGGLSLEARGETPRQLHFAADGLFSLGPCSPGHNQGGEQQGRWQLWPDGSLELTLEQAGGTVRERLWFTKPNLRLRSTILSPAQGGPSQASFSSEIRRVSRAADSTS